MLPFGRLVFAVGATISLDSPIARAVDNAVLEVHRS